MQKPVRLFEGNYFAHQLSARTYDVSPDGRRFLMVAVMTDPLKAAPRMLIVKNWFAELKRLVPAN